MGVAVDHSRKTSELATWISRFRVKKTNFKYQKRKNLFIEAVLANALTRAETELRQKQQERRLRWQNLMSKCAINTDCDKLPQNWDMRTYQEINAELDTFMNQLNNCSTKGISSES